MKRTAIYALVLILIGSASSAPQTPQAPSPAKPDAAKPDVAKPAATAASAVQAARAALLKAEGEHPGNTPELAAALHALVGSEIEAGTVDRGSLEDVNRELRVAEAATGARSKGFVSALADQADVLIRLSRASEARPAAERAFAIAHQAFPGTADEAGAASELGTACTALGDYPCALRAFQMAIDTTRKISGNDSADLKEPLNE